MFGLDDILGTALGFVGDIFASDHAADTAYDKNSALQAQNIAWQREQLQNKHQWEVEDLKKAGLNPILSAQTGSSAVSAGAPSVSASPASLTKALDAVASSALSKKQTELAEFQSQTERIRADADMLRARQEEARTASAIEVNQSQARLQVKQTEMLDKNYELQRAYTEANVREIDQRIINSVAEVQAKVRYLEESGRAALMSASAAQTHAAAALQSAQAQAIIAQVAEANGISQRQLNDALAGKASQETKEAWQRTENLLQSNAIKDWQLAKDKAHNPIASGNGNIVNSENFLFGVGEVIRNGWNPSNLVS